jgi:biotin carboxyl carrier protein
MSTRIRFLHFSFIFACLVFLSLSCKNGSQPTEEDIIVKTPVTVVPVEHKTVISSVDLPAHTTYMNKSIIRATTAGTIEKISVNPGDYISQGKLLFSIITREAMALRNNTNRDSTLVFKGLINITSNTGGVINSISYQKGDFVQEGDELAVISEQNSLVFILDVPFELDRYIAANKKCVIVLPDNRHLRGTITGKLAEMDIQSQTLKYIVKPSVQLNLPSNLIGIIPLVKSTDNKATVLPKAAVLSNETQTEFWVMKLINDSTAVKIIVTKGFENNDEVQITEPEFLPTDRIILTGNYGLPDTARIEIKKE